MEEKFVIGQGYTVKVNKDEVAECDEAFIELSEMLGVDVFDTMIMQGIVVWKNDKYAVCRVTYSTAEWDWYVTNYDGIKQMLDDFNGVEHDEDSRYFCVHMKSEWPHLFEDPEEELDEEDKKQFEDYIHKLNEVVSELKNSAEKREEFKQRLLNFEGNSPRIEVTIPEIVLTDLVKQGYMECVEPQLCSNDNSSHFAQYGVGRTINWITKCDCAILTAFRNSEGFTKALNKKRNNDLKEALITLGFGVIGIMGVYAEVGKDASKEESFLVFDRNNEGQHFFNSVRSLSEKYDQDCFLYKKSGMNSDAYLYATNDDWRNENGDCVKLGKFHIAETDCFDRSEIGSMNIIFN